MRVSLRVRILVAHLAVIAVIAAGAGYAGLTGSDQLARRIRSLSAEALIPLTVAQHMNEALDDMRITFLDGLHTSNGIDGLAKRIAEWDELFDRSFQRYRSLMTLEKQPEMQALRAKYGGVDDGSVREEEALRLISTGFAQLKERRSDALAALADAGEEKALNIYFAQCSALFQRLDDNIETLMKLQVEEGEYAERDSDELFSQSRRVVFGGLALSGLLAAGVALVSVRPISRGIRALLSGTKRIAAGDLDTRVDVRTNDELGELADSFNQMSVILRSTTAKLSASQRTAVAANQSKSDFLAQMSHEIRTPMAAILGYADRLQRPDCKGEALLEAITSIQRNGRHLLSVINDILDLSRIEAGVITIERIECSPCRIMAEVASAMGMHAIEKGLGLELRCLNGVPQTIHSDPTRLRQILINLVGNAIKFTAAGEVRMTVALVPHGRDGRRALRFEVIDTGIGISTDEQRGIFEPFVQADSSITRKYGGTGLGLAITRKLAQMLGGEIAVKSAPGHGSTFALLLDPGPLDGVIVEVGDFSIQPRTNQSANAATITLNARILLVEDGRDNRRLISLQLREAGADVTFAENGREALDKVATGAFDLIVMDMQMPMMDGYAATSELRRRGCTLPIIALTAHALDGEREKCLNCGCNEYLSKPVDSRLLLMTCGRYLDSGGWVDHPGPSVVALDTPGSAQDGTAMPRAGLCSEAADAPAMREAVFEYVADLPTQVGALLDHYREADIEALRRVVHNLKGTAGGYGFPNITNAAQKLEAQLSLGTSLIDCGDQVRSLAEMVRSIEGYVPANEGKHD